MDDGVELGGALGAVVFHTLDLAFVGPLEDAVAGDVEALLLDVVTHPFSTSRSCTPVACSSVTRLSTPKCR